MRKIIVLRVQMHVCAVVAGCLAALSGAALAGVGAAVTDVQVCGCACGHTSLRHGLAITAEMVETMAMAATGRQLFETISGDWEANGRPTSVAPRQLLPRRRQVGRGCPSVGGVDGLFEGHLSRSATAPPEEAPSRTGGNEKYRGKFRGTVSKGDELCGQMTVIRSAVQRQNVAFLCVLGD